MKSYKKNKQFRQVLIGFHDGIIGHHEFTRRNKVKNKKLKKEYLKIRNRNFSRLLYLL